MLSCDDGNVIGRPTVTGPAEVCAPTGPVSLWSGPAPPLQDGAPLSGLVITQHKRQVDKACNAHRPVLTCHGVL